MAAQYYDSIPRWQRCTILLFQSPDGNTILWANPQMPHSEHFSHIWRHTFSRRHTTFSHVAPRPRFGFSSLKARYKFVYLLTYLFPLPDGSTIFQSIDGSTISWVHPRWQHNIIIQSPRWQHNIMIQTPDGSTMITSQSAHGNTIDWSIDWYISITRWQHNSSIPRWQHNNIFQSPDSSTISFFNQQMAAQ